MDSKTALEKLHQQIIGCRVCAKELPCVPRPIVQLDARARVLIIGQAPGMKAHLKNKLFDDSSGSNLREWLGVCVDEFYGSGLFAVMPMGFCFPGKGDRGDLAPRKECAPLWHQQVLRLLPNVELILLIGSYAQKYYLPHIKGQSLTHVVQNFKAFLPQYFPLPHPSPLNFIWQSKNSWFKTDVVPELQYLIKNILSK